MLVILPTIAAPTMRQMLTNMAASVTLLLLYYGGSEALWARTPGKALLGLTLVDGGGRPPRPAAAFARALLFILPNILLGLSVVAIWGQGLAAVTEHLGRMNAFSTIGQLLSLATLFAAARRRNGYAGLHDLATGIRVVEQRATTGSERPAAAPTPHPAAAPVVGHRGPFAVLDGTIEGRPEWRPGRDERLRRPVWIRDVPIGTPPVAAARVALSRPTRLRWLAGRRTAQEAWDVYEGVAGVPIAQACRSPRSWSEARRWLADLAHELAAQQPGDQPPLDLDRVWILDSGRAKLLDDPTADPSATTSRLADGIGLLLAVARRARAHSRQPWPLSATRFVDALGEAPPASLSDVAASADASTRGRTAISRGWRGLSLAGLLALPLMSCAGMVGVMLMMATQARTVPARTRTAAHVLRELERRSGGSHSLEPADREAVEIVLASRYRSELSDPALYAPERFLLLTPAHKTLADRILRRTIDPRSVDAAAARPEVRDMLAAGAQFELPPIPGLAVMIFYITLIAVALAGLVAALATRGAILRLLGFEIMTTEGRRAGRGRVLARAAIAWSPILVPLIATGVIEGVGAHLPNMIPVFGAALAVQCAGAIVAIAQPARGLQDRLAGTWIVPR